MGFTKHATRYLLACALLISSACNPSPNVCTSGNRVSLERADLRAALYGDLERANIPVQQSEIGEICYPKDRSDYVNSRIIALDLAQRPLNQITIAGGRFATSVSEELTKAEIEFVMEERHGEVVLTVVDQEQIGRVVEVIDLVAEQLYTSK
jgi:hypothetical protein